mgnify:CR=1 FL=1
MYKKDIIDAIAASTGVTKSDTEFMLNEFIQVISDALVRGDAVHLPRLGQLYGTTVEGHDAFIPTGDEVHRAAHKRVWFRPAKELKDRLNSSGTTT